MLDFTKEELVLIAQWFGSVQDVNTIFLEEDDYKLASKLYQALGWRVPHSISENTGDAKSLNTQK